MAESAVSSGLGMLLAPSQGALKSTPSLDNEQLSADNPSSFSSIFDAQNPSSEESVSPSVESSAAFVDAPIDVVDIGQVLPHGGNGLPLVADTAGLDGVSTVAVLDESGLMVTSTETSSAADVYRQDVGVAAFESDSIVGQILQSALPQGEWTQSVSAPVTNQSVDVDPAAAEDGLTSQPVLTGSVAVAAQVSLLNDTSNVLMMDSVVESSDDMAATGIPLLSMMDRKSKVGEALNVDKRPSDFASTTSSLTALSDKLQSTSLKTDTDSFSSEEFELVAQKMSDANALNTNKQPTSFDLGSAGMWRTTTTEGFSSNGLPSLTMTAIDIPVGKAGWDAAVMEKVMFMSSQKLDTLEIALDPAELGPMHVRITANQEHTAVVFNAQNVQVREALDQASSQLRQQLENQGFGRVSVDVGGQDAQQNMASGQETEGQGGSGTQSGDEPLLSQDTGVVTAKAVKLGLVDTFV